MKSGICASSCQTSAAMIRGLKTDPIMQTVLASMAIEGELSTNDLHVLETRFNGGAVGSETVCPK